MIRGSWTGRRSLALSFIAALVTASPASVAAPPVETLPLIHHAGPFASGHVQGIAIDRRRGFIYYSFTNLLAKYDFNGRLVGTLAGWSGHLGDLDFNPDDGQVYGSLEYKKAGSFYIAVIDVARLNRVGLTAGETDILRTVFLREVAVDYGADLDGDGAVADDPASPDHRYGCSGIDGVAFGPAFGRTSGQRYLTVAYGIYGNVARGDNDHQVLLQYDIAGWPKYALPLVEGAPHRSGPLHPAGRFFVRTGNTRFGVQNLAYDDRLQRWFLGVYPGAKPRFPNYLLFAVDAKATPVRSQLVGVPGRAGEGEERGLLLPLSRDGLRDAATGIRGWMQKADVGFQPVGDGLFYIATSGGSKGRQVATARLKRWTGQKREAFNPVT